MQIAILSWWISAERPVALRSGENMRDWCIIAWHSVDIYDVPTKIPDFLVKYRNYDLVIPVLHGIYGEDGQITAFLETLGCQTAYSSFIVHSFCIDKYRTNLLIEKIGIKIPRSLLIARWHTIESLVAPLICYPVIVKPNRGGSSLSTSRVDTREWLIWAQQAIIGDDILIQECIEGREFTVGVYRDGSGYHTLPIVEICTGERLFDYKEKYETDGSNEIFMEWEDELQKRLSDESLRICRYIKTGWIVRIDWRYDGSDLYFLEINTIPGFTPRSLIPKMWKKAGKTEGEFVEILRD